MIVKIDFPDSNEGLEKYWEALRKRTYHKSFESVSRFVKQQDLKHSVRPRGKRPLKRLLPLLILLAVLSSFTLKVKEREYHGAFLRLHVYGNQADIDRVRTLTQLEGSNSFVQVEADSPLAIVTTFFEQNKLAKVAAFRLKLQRLANVSAIEVDTVQTTVQASLLSAFLYKTFRLRLSARGVSDQTVKALIEKKLSTYGLFIEPVITRFADGRRKIELKPTAKTPARFSVELNVDDSAGRLIVKEQRSDTDNPRYAQMTDEQIRNQIIHTHANLQIQPGEIQIKRTDSTVEIVVRLETSSEIRLFYRVTKHN